MPESITLSDAEPDPRRHRLATIADRHLEKMGKLPFADRLTVASTILGSVIGEVDEGQQLAVLDEVLAGLREWLLAGGLG